MLLGGQWPGYPEIRVPTEGPEGPGYTPLLSLTDTELGFLRELDLCVGTLRVSIAVQVSPESLRGLAGLSPPLFYVWTLDYFFYSEVNQSTLPLLSYVAKVTGLASLFRFSS